MASNLATLEPAEFVAVLSGVPLDAYTARANQSGGIELWAITTAGEIFNCHVSQGAEMPSLFAGDHQVEFFEREIHQMFGVKFSRPESNQPLYVGSAEWVGLNPLDDKKLLSRRNATAWPGAKEPGVDNPVGKRRLLPPGVDPDSKAEEWL